MLTLLTIAIFSTMEVMPTMTKRYNNNNNITMFYVITILIIIFMINIIINQYNNKSINNIKYSTYMIYVYKYTNIETNVN